MIFGIEISSPEFTLSKKERASLKLSGVKTGDVIRAKVADLLPQGRAAFLVAGRRVIAKTDLPLTKGDSLLLEVIRGEGALSLKPAAGTQPAIQPQAGGGNPGLAALLAKAGADLELLSKIDDPGVKHIINTLALKSGRRDDNFLPRLIEQLGLTLEKKISVLAARTPSKTVQAKVDMGQLVKTDLKAALFHLLSTEKEGTGTTSLKRAANTLESFTQLNSQTGEGNRFLLPFPVASPGFFDFGQLFINTGGRSGKETEKKDRVIEVAFLMNMTALGRLRADFSFFRKKVTGGFLLEDQEICDYMTSLVPQLKSRLASIGFTAGKIGCRVAPQDCFSPGELVKAVAGGRRDHTRTLDLVI